MQEATSEPARKLLTARDVQVMLEVDRSTVYRMAEDGRLPAIKVGRQWRFPADRIVRLLQAEGSAPAAVAVPAQTVAPQAESRAGSRAEPRAESPAESPVSDRAIGEEALSVLEISAELLGVMMVVTDMDGRPVSPVVNRCAWFAERADDPETVNACTVEWQSMADDPDCSPHFHTGVLGFDCARAFVRSGSSLIGMVLAGGIAPPASATPGLYHLDEAARRQVLRGLPKVAAALSHVSPRNGGGPDRRSES